MNAPAVPPAAISNAALRASITELAGHLNAANHRFLTLIAEFDRRRVWAHEGTQSCAHWLNWQCGIDLGAARERIRVAHALQKLPRISAAMGRGELSYSKVRAITRVADEATEGTFLSIALHGTANHVEKVVRCYRRARKVAELSREARQQANRSVLHWYDADGSLIIRARLPAESGALFIRALEAAQAELPAQHVSAETCGDTPAYAARRADALALVADVFLRQGSVALAGGDRHEIIVHVDAETLSHNTPGRCGLSHGPSLPAETARRLSCDAGIVVMTDDAKGEPLNVGRKTRSIPPALRRALQARDRGCCFPGCPNHRFVDGHHIRHWARGGETSLSNLVSLCHYHHRQVHEGGMTVTRQRDGTWRFVTARGKVVRPTTPVCSGWRDLLDSHAALAIRIDAGTAVTRWRGETMDYGVALDCLFSARRARRVSAETSRS